MSNASLGLGNVVDGDRWGFSGDSPQQALEINFGTDMNMSMGIDDNTFTWEMIGLGLEEPLPPQDTIDELYVMHHSKFRDSMLMKLVQASNLF